MSRRPLHLIFATLVLSGALAIALAGPLSAQEEDATPTPPPTPVPTATPTAYPLQKFTLTLLADAGAQVESQGPSVTRAAALYVQPGQTSVPFINEGVTVLSVIAGSLTVESDMAVIKVTDLAYVLGLQPVSATPGPIEATVVNPGEQVYLPAGATTTISNNTEAVATVYVVAVIPTGAPTATP